MGSLSFSVVFLSSGFLLALISDGRGTINGGTFGVIGVLQIEGKVVLHRGSLARLMDEWLFFSGLRSTLLDMAESA